MKIDNKLDRNLSQLENDSLESIRLILEKCFNKSIFKVAINADVKDEKEVYGLSFAFDMRKN